MAQIDATMNEPTPTEDIAERADCYRIAVALIKGAGLAQDAEPQDVLNLTQFLYVGQDL